MPTIVRTRSTLARNRYAGETPGHGIRRHRSTYLKGDQVLLTYGRRAATTTCAVAVSLLLTPAASSADDHDPGNRPENSRVEWLDVDYDPNLSHDAFVTDDMEAQNLLTAGVTCTYEAVQTGPNAAPASPSFQLLYVLPSDATANSAIDVPRSCSDGSVRYSALARASRNLATWQYRRTADLNYRTVSVSYTHNYNGSSYSTRAVRRFRSIYSTATWQSLAMYDEGDPNVDGDETSPRLSRMRTELLNAGFGVANTRYQALLSVEAERSNCDSQNQCEYTVGIAETPGKYGMVTRYYPTPSGRVVIRYGCASTDGDGFLGHESTHQVGAEHVHDNVNDLMSGYKSNANFNTSPYLLWDYNRDDYDATVRASVYVIRSGLSGSYFTC